MSKRLMLLNVVVVACALGAAWLVLSTVQGYVYEPMCYAAATRKGYDLTGFRFDRVPLEKNQRDYACVFNRLAGGEVVDVLSVPLEPGEFTGPRAECLAIPAVLVIGILGGLISDRERKRKAA